MAAFQLPDDEDRLDWVLLKNGPVHLYWKRAILAEDVRRLQDHGYEIHSLDCSAWQSVDDFHTDISRALQFPDYYGRNLNALNDCLCNWQLEVSDPGGMALVFHQFDRFACLDKEFAWHVLDIIAWNSRQFLLIGCRLVALVQSDDPRLGFDRVGGTQPRWNPREWLNRSRGI